MGVRSVLGIAAMVLAGLSSSASAQDTWRDPHPGVRWLHRQTSSQNVNLLVVDLCAAGVSARATASSERRQTPSSFGAAAGAQVAVNGDFFSFETYSTDGLSMHDGAQWPGTGDHGYVGPVAFGDRRAEIVPHHVVAGPEPWMREIVSGHPTILIGGAVQDHSGDPLCSNRHPRTALGLSADRRTLFVAVIDGRATGRIGMTCAEEAELLRGLGASVAVNMDGGGSSAMWIAGQGVVSRPSDGRERVVANHLAIYARGSGPAAHCPNAPPRGWLDAASCDAVRGWAQDPDAPADPIPVHLYFGGPAGDPAAIGIPTTAGVHRDDLCEAIGSCGHGFEVGAPRALLDGTPREVFAYGIDSEGGPATLLEGAPATLRCDPPALPLSPADGTLRHVASPEVMEAWGLSFLDVAPVGGAALASYDRGASWPPAVELVRAEGEDAVYVIDGEHRRHVSSPEVLAAWGFDWGAVRVIGADERDSRPPGAPWPDEPFLVRGDGPEVYVVDRAEPSEPAAHRDGGVLVDDAGPLPRAHGAADADARMLSGGCSTSGASHPPNPLGTLALLLALAWRRVGRRQRSVA